MELKELKYFYDKAEKREKKYFRYFYLLSLGYYLSILEKINNFTFLGINISTVFNHFLWEGIFILFLSFILFKLMTTNKIVNEISNKLKNNHNHSVSLISFLESEKNIYITVLITEIGSYLLPIGILLCFHCLYLNKIFSYQKKLFLIIGIIILLISLYFLYISLKLFYSVLKK